MGSQTPEFLDYCKDTLKLYGLSGVNVALTSPPYFDREKYDGDRQSYKDYPTYPEWTTGFLKFGEYANAAIGFDRGSHIKNGLRSVSFWFGTDRRADF